MNASYALPAVNFFMADVGGGLGPFLSTFLADVAHWNPAQIGWVVAAGSITGALLAGPAGSMVDRLGKPRLMLAGACCLILAGTLTLLPARAFWLIVMAQIVVSAGGALGSPSISGLTLAVVGKKGYPKQQGTNEAANHTGNVTAAGLVALLSMAFGGWALWGFEMRHFAAIAVLAVMASATLLVLWLMDPKAIDADRMRGRKKREKGEKRGLTNAIALSTWMVCTMGGGRGAHSKPGAANLPIDAWRNGFETSTRTSPANIYPAPELNRYRHRQEPQSRTRWPAS